MTEALIGSVLLLWIVVLVLCGVVAALTRQIGLLHERVAPAGALAPTSGPKVGELAQEIDVVDLHGTTQTIGGARPNGRALLTLFVSPTCPVCKSLVPTAMRLAKQEQLDLVFASDGDDRTSHDAYVEDMHIAPHPYVLSEPLGRLYGVSKLPFATLIGADGTLAAKGLVNTREHLESLLNAMNTGVATLQEYVQQHHPEVFDAANIESDLPSPGKRATPPEDLEGSIR